MKTALFNVNLLFIVLSIFWFQQSKAQLDSIYDQGKYRTFILHLPKDYNEEKNYPLMLCLHGLNSDAAKQELYSNMNTVSDTADFIVLYPNAVDGSWELNGESDVIFFFKPARQYKKFLPH